MHKYLTRPKMVVMVYWNPKSYFVDSSSLSIIRPTSIDYNSLVSIDNIALKIGQKNQISSLERCEDSTRTKFAISLVEDKRPWTLCFYFLLRNSTILTFSSFFC